MVRETSNIAGKGRKKNRNPEQCTQSIMSQRVEHPEQVREKAANSNQIKRISLKGTPAADSRTDKNHDKIVGILKTEEIKEAIVE